MARSIGDTVKWNWGQGTAEGQITQIYKQRVTKTLKGSEIVRDGDEDNPAYLIEQSDGDQVLKLESELD
ncbi:DUF2945 domain-containing protein [uncultured Salinisphaera sp.]|uniref:DUF2945 domain-containing protein n=1 Tax=uncultured Salinisphaera sp. TaxID=359372 RepID=UPI0032B1659C